MIGAITIGLIVLSVIWLTASITENMARSRAAKDLRDFLEGYNIMARTVQDQLCAVVRGDLRRVGCAWEWRPR
jgi:hypothetical protein